MSTKYIISPSIPNVNKKTGEGKIALLVVFNNLNKRETISFSTNLKCKKDNFENGKPKDNKLKKLLADEIHLLQNDINNLKIKGIEINPENLREYRENKKNEGKTLVEFISMVKEYKLDNFKNHTPINYDSLIYNIQELEKKKKKTYYLSDINQKFINELILFFKSKNLRSTTIKLNYINMLKSVLNHLFKINVLDDSFKKLDYSVDVVLSDLPILLDSEIEQLGKFTTSNKVDDRVRDLALIQIFTGLRISDLRSLSKENFSNGQLKTRTKKTKELVVVDLVDKIIPILEKYDYDLAQYLNFHTHNFNRRLRKILKELKMDRKIEYVEEINGQVKSTYLELNEMVSSHDLRRTTISVLSSLGWTAEQIQSVTGHKDVRSVHRYIKVNRNQISEKMKVFGSRFNF